MAKSFDSLAAANGYSLHHGDIVFSPGPGGTAGAMWSNSRLRTRNEGKLATGEIEILGMTGGKADKSFEDYQRWIDLALKYNPNTRFFIGHCWIPGGPRIYTSAFTRLIEESDRRQFEVVARLRETYPENQICFINYGKTASIMKEILKQVSWMVSTIWSVRMNVRSSSMG